MKARLLLALCLSVLGTQVFARPNVQAQLARQSGVLELDDLLKNIPGLKAQQMMLEVIQTPTLVMFYQPVCPPCDDMKPVLDKLALELPKYGLKVRILKVNIANHRGLIAPYGVTRTPKFSFFKSRRIIDMFWGRKSLPELVTFIRRSLA